jgi:hypothetical protein
MQIINTAHYSVMEQAVQEGFAPWLFTLSPLCPSVPAPSMASAWNHGLKPGITWFTVSWRPNFLLYTVFIRIQLHIMSCWISIKNFTFNIRHQLHKHWDGSVCAYCSNCTVHLFVHSVLHLFVRARLLIWSHNYYHWIKKLKSSCQQQKSSTFWRTLMYWNRAFIFGIAAFTDFQGCIDIHICCIAYSKFISLS